MQRLSEHIASLLLHHDCVIIPGIGGFVLQPRSAIFSTHDSHFNPPGKEIVFNPTLNYDDGLLAQSYMAGYRLTFDEARKAVQSDIASLRQALHTEGMASLGTVGTFRYEHGAPVFDPADSVVITGIKSYGLSAFYFPPLTTNRTVTSARHTSTRTSYTLPTYARRAMQVAGAAAVAASLLLIYTPVDEVKPNAFKASFVPSELLTPRQVATATVDTLPVVTNKRVPTIERPERHTFYVVIGSFDSQWRMQRFLADTGLHGLKNVGIVHSDGLYRIYADRTTDRSQADTYMTQLRQDERFKQTWVYIGR